MKLKKWRNNKQQLKKFLIGFNSSYKDFIWSLKQAVLSKIVIIIFKPIFEKFTFTEFLIIAN